MKKIISLCFACFLLTVVSFGQEASNKQVKKECVPTKECAEKMGMTLEQCKALCKKADMAKTAEATNETAVMASTKTKGKSKAKAKKCSTSIEECAAKKGMSVAEYKAQCKKKCNGASGTAATTSVASAVMENEKAEAPKANKKGNCTKGSKKAACCKKKQ